MFSLRKFAVMFAVAGGLTPMLANTARYYVNGTATSTAGSSAPVSAIVEFTTMQDMVVVSITNNIIGASKDVQAVASIDFVLDTLATTGSISSQSGLVRSIDKNGNFRDGDWALDKSGNFTGTSATRPSNFSDSSYNGEWTVLASGTQTSGLTNGLTLTTLNGGNPSLTIFGPPDSTSATCCYNDYGAPNNAVTKHNPYLVSDGQAVTFYLAVTGVTSSTNILGNNVRFFFGTDRSAYLDGIPDSSAPEPATVFTGAAGILAMLWRRRQQARP